MTFAKLLDSLRRRVEAPASASADTETVRKIVRALDRMPPDHARQVAAFAYVLSRVARADMKITETETAEMERLVMQRGGLPEEQAVLVVQIAKTQATLFGGTENFLVTSEYNDMAKHEEKIRLLHCLFSVAAADGSISNVEDREIRLISDELQLRHDEYIDVRLQYKQHLAVLRSASDAVSRT